MKQMLGIMCAFIVFCYAAIGYAAEKPKDLIITVGDIPGLSYVNDTGEFVGPFVDLATAIGTKYQELYGGKFKIIHRGFAGSINNATQGNADVHLPVFRNNDLPKSIYKFRMVDEPTGKLAVVLYTKKGSKVNKQLIDKMLKEGNYNLKIEGARGMEFCYYFPVISTHQIDSSLNKVHTGRIDGLAWPQDEVNAMIKNKKWGDRFDFEFIGKWDDALVIKSGKAGDWTNEVVSKCLRELKTTKEYQAIYGKIHAPFNEKPF